MATLVPLSLNMYSRLELNAKPLPVLGRVLEINGHLVLVEHKFTSNVVGGRMMGEHNGLLALGH